MELPGTSNYEVPTWPVLEILRRSVIPEYRTFPLPFHIPSVTPHEKPAKSKGNRLCVGHCMNQSTSPSIWIHHLVGQLLLSFTRACWKREQHRQGRINLGWFPSVVNNTCLVLCFTLTKPRLPLTLPSSRAPLHTERPTTHGVRLGRRPSPRL